MEKGPKIIIEPPGPRAKQIIERDKNSVMQSFSRWYPLVVDKGDGVFIYDVDGNKYLDFNAGIAVNALGYSNKRLQEAITNQTQKLIHYSFTDFLYESTVRLAEKLIEISPINKDVKIFFGNSGAEANEAMMKVARWSTRRQNIIAFIGSFHGRTYGAMSLTASRPVQRRFFGPFVPNIEHVPFPYCYRCPFGLNPENCDLFCVDYIEEQVFQKFVPPEETALFIAEAIQGEGGYIPAPEAYFKKLKKILDKYGILLGVDEVQSGVGRTGKWFAIEHYGVKPDLVSIAKAIGGGLPLGILLGRSELMELDAGSHASTFGGNPVSCEAALIVIDEIEKRRLLEKVTLNGEYVLKRLKEFQEKIEKIGDVRGRGLMIGIELVKDRKSKEPATKMLEEVLVRCWKRGLAIIGAGKSVIRICPPLIIEREELDIGLDILEAVLKETEK